MIILWTVNQPQGCIYNHYLQGYGGIGRHGCFKYNCESIRVQIPLSLPFGDMVELVDTTVLGAVAKA